MRNFYHILIGFSLMYAIGNLTEFSTFTLTSKIVGCTFASIIIGGVLGFFWEWCQALINPKVFDLNDILRTAFGSLLGGLTSILYPNLSILMYVSCSVSAIIVGIELFLRFNKKT